MGQQPNIELRLEDLPRAAPEPAAPKRWSPHRPGELGSPEAVPWGGRFGTPGPDSGFAFKLVAERELALGPTERRADVEAVAAAVAAARASKLGRAPRPEDVDVALLALGLLDDDLPSSLIESLAGDRASWVGSAALQPEKARAVVAGFDPDLLVAPFDELRGLMRAGQRLIEIR